MAEAGRVALIAGQGVLPPLLAARLDDPLIAALDGFPPDGLDAMAFRLERLVPFMDHLLDAGVDAVCFAGALRRPRLDPELFDHRTASIVPRILAAMQSGDDAALREVLALFEESGFRILAATDIAPDLLPAPAVLAGNPTAADRADAARAAMIVAALGAQDLGQGAVVAQGLCLAVETLPGTDAMLDFVTLHQGLRPDPKGPGGVLYKAPKPGQEWRIDLPTVGPDTVRRAARAGLSGIAWQAGGVILLEPELTATLANEAGLFLWSRPDQA